MTMLEKLWGPPPCTVGSLGSSEHPLVKGALVGILGAALCLSRFPHEALSPHFIDEETEAGTC